MSSRGVGVALRPHYLFVMGTTFAVLCALSAWLVPGATASPPTGGEIPSGADRTFFPSQPDVLSRGTWITSNVTMPTDHRPAPSASCANTARSRGWVAAENRRPGTRIWRISPYQRDSRASVGYLDRVTASCGDTVSLHLSGPGPWTRVTAVRMGWYRGAGGRAVWSSERIPTSAQSRPQPQPGTRMVEAGWPASVRIPITSAWPPGVYMLVLRSADGARSVVPLTVRNGQRSARLLYMASVFTWQAYNDYGGYNLYHGPHKDKANRSRVVSFDRPYAGSGLVAIFLYDLPLVRYVEQLGYDVDYTDDLDVDQRPSQLLDYRGLVVPGHSEYWTRRMYDAVEYARDAGVNVAFFGGNQVYWRARLEGGPGGADRRIAVYRDVREDRAAQRDLSLATVRWGSWPLNRPALTLLGANFARYGTVAHFRIVSAKSWVFAGTGLADGSVLRRSVAGEWDHVVADPRTPPTVQVLAEAPIIGEDGTPSLATMSYYTAPSRAGVFNAGVNYWPCHLYGACHKVRTDPQTRAAFRTITRNVLRVFAQGPAGFRHPSVPRPPDDPAELVRSSRPEDVAIIGRIGDEEQRGTVKNSEDQ